MKTIPIAVQLYTLREEVERDFAGTLKKVAQLGFEGVELAGFGGFHAEEVKGILDNCRLQAVASHIPLHDLRNNLPIIIEEQKIIGSKYIVVPYLLPEQRTEEGYQALISFLDEAGETCSREGISLCYHHHEFELERLADGKTVLETILENTNASLVKAELDIYWLTKVGESPTEWLKRYQYRTPLVHLKDMTTDAESFFAELGTGGVDVEAVLNIGTEVGVKWWIVEQDMCRRNPFESLEISMNYLKKVNGSGKK